MIWASLLLSSLWIKESGSVWTTSASVVCVTHSHSNNTPRLVSPCLSVWVLCWLSPHTLAVSSVAQSGFVFAQQPSTEYNPRHFLQHQEPVPLENSLKCIMTFNIFTPSFSSLHASAWVVLRSPGAPCPLWNMAFAEAALSLSCHHQCPHTGTAEHQPPSRLQSLQNLLGGISMSEGLWFKCEGFSLQRKVHVVAMVHVLTDTWDSRDFSLPIIIIIIIYN